MMRRMDHASTQHVSRRRSRSAVTRASFILIIVLASCMGCGRDSRSTPLVTAPGPRPFSVPVSTAKSGPRLVVPSIDVDVELSPQGLANGVINPRAGQAVWFTGYGRMRPGELGTSVVAAHVVNGNSPDVFSKLHLIKDGETFTIIDMRNDKYDFQVVKAFVVDKDELTTNAVVWGPNNSVRRVVLVTCDDAMGFSSNGHRRANYVVVGEAA